MSRHHHRGPRRLPFGASPRTAPTAPVTVAKASKPARLTAADIQPGDMLLWNWPKRNREGTPFRVETIIKEGEYAGMIEGYATIKESYGSRIVWATVSLSSLRRKEEHTNEVAA